MSASSVPRLKDRGGAGAKISAPKPSKPQTPISSAKPITGKENPNPNPNPNHKPSSRGSAQKHTVRTLPRVSGVSTGRFSTSSVPRGRSPSPFGRTNLGGKKGSIPDRVSLDSCEVETENRVLRSAAEVKSSNGSGNGSRVLRKSGACTETELKVGDFSGLGTKTGAKLTKSDINIDTVVNSSERSGFDSTGKVKDGVQMEKKLEGRPYMCEKPLSSLLVSEKLKGKLSSLEVAHSKVDSKYQSRLHEKLAFLEGKVKRIASDIKRTKEMLDMNNPDESKVILSDIQEKISGIEKAMNHAIGASDVKNGASKEAADDTKESEYLREKIEGEIGNRLKSSVKDLSSEELEARLFPHHKLLRKQTSLKTSRVEDVTPKLEEKNTSNVEEKALNLINKNPITVEVLSSSSKEQLKVTDQAKEYGVEIHEVQEMDIVSTAEAEEKFFHRKDGPEVVLTTDETLDEFDDQENGKGLILEEMNEDACVYQPNEIGCKTSTGGWFVSEGEAVLLVHSDGSCSYYDVANEEEKAEYKPSVTLLPNIWRDCWLVRAPGTDGCSSRYVVAASAGNTLEAGFCSWEFYSKEVQAFHIEDRGPTVHRRVLEPLPTNTSYQRNVLSNTMESEGQQWWYRPCGPLIISSASCQSGVRVFDIRDGEQIMKWETQKPVVAMDYSSPVQWRSRGKVVIADGEGVSLWDVNSQIPQALLSVLSSSGRKVSALHVNNTDAELGGGVRQRVSSSEAEGNDGVICTPDSIEVLDFRHPSGIGLKIKIPALISAGSVFSRGDSIFLGCMSCKSGAIKSSASQLQQFSLRRQTLVGNYALPDESSTHSSHSAITQVWGNSNLIMGISGLGLFVFDSVKDDSLHIFSSSADYSCASPKVREVIGPDDLYSPSFDYSSSRTLIISRDRPALWRYLD